MADLGILIKCFYHTKNSGRYEVLIQPMLENVIRSGVAFSHDPNTCSHIGLLIGQIVRIQQLLQVEREAVHGYKQQSFIGRNITL